MFTFDKMDEKQMALDWNCLLGKLQIFGGFIGLCRVGAMYCMKLLDKKLTRPGPEISVHSGVTLSVFFV